MLRHIMKIAPVEGPRYITQLLDEFEHRGPNGIHKCLVLEPMGPDGYAMVEELPQFKPRKLGMRIRYPPQIAKGILKQSLQALVFLHESGIAHGNLHLGNMLFSLNDIDSAPEDSLLQAKDVQTGSISPPVRRLDGKADKWAPPYLCIAQPLAPFTADAQGLKLKLCDMGQAYLFTDPPARSFTLLAFRPPEMILNEGVNPATDIWAFGCLIFELMSGHQLFWVNVGNDEHLLLLNDLIGTLPDEIFNQWTNSSLYFTPERKLFNRKIGGLAPGEEAFLPEPMSMEEEFDEARPDLDEEEANKVKVLIRRILQYDPAKRPSAAEILSDPWFREIDVESNPSKVST